MTRTRQPKKADPIFAVIKRLRRAELAIDAAGDAINPRSVTRSTRRWATNFMRRDRHS
jgi:hypothetical protein